MATGVSGLDFGFVTHPIIAPRWESTAVPHLHSVPSRNAERKSFTLSMHIFKNEMHRKALTWNKKNDLKVQEVM